MNRTSFRRAPRRGRVVIGLTAITLLGGAVLLGGAARKSEPAVGSDAAPSGQGGTAQLAAMINTQFGLTRSDVIRVDTSGATAGQPVHTIMRVRDQLYTLDLEVHSSRAPNYRVYVMNGDDEKVEIAPGPVNTYRGTLAEAPGSMVVASLMADGLHGHVRFADGETWWFEGMGDRLGDGPEFDGLHVVYNDADVIPSEGTCGCENELLANAHEHFQLAEAPRTAQSSGSGPRVAEIACEADERFIDRWTSQTESRINTIIDTVNSQYLRDVNVVHQIVALVLHETDPSDYTSNDASTLLTQFRLHWLDDHNDIHRHVAQLFTGRDLIGSTIGIAWLGVICDSVFNGLGFGLVQSDCCGSLACATDLSADELGHNWDAEHCNCLDWTMNPNLQCDNRFHPTFTIPTIMNFADSLTCLSDIAPANNSCVQPTNIGDGNFAFTTIGSTTDGGTSGCGVMSKDIWYEYTASCDGTATAGLCGSDFDTRIGVYALGDFAGAPFACNEDSCGEQSEVSWEATEGTSYLVRVGGRNAEGSGTLVLSCEAGPYCPSDVDGDGLVGFDDILEILRVWGATGGPADVDGDGLVGFDDILEVLSNWGTVCP